MNEVNKSFSNVVLCSVLDSACLGSSRLFLIFLFLVKMLILQTYKFLDKLMDLDSLNRIGFRTAYISMSFVSWFTVSLIDLIVNFRDFKVVAQPLIMVTGHVIVITIYWRFVISRARFVQILDDFQSIVDESMSKRL